MLSIGNQANHAFRDMRVEVVGYHMPSRGRRAGGEQGFQEAGVVLLGVGVADDAQHLAGRDVEGGNQGLGAVTDVFELASHKIARAHRQIGGGALQRLHAGHLIDRHRAYVL